ncbi:MAG: hypothetical protein AABY15_06920 [Nanoarchaeota archaeon]
MSRKERQTQTIERRKKKERIEKVREKRWSKKDEEQMEAILMEAKKILGIF